MLVNIVKSRGKTAVFKIANQGSNPCVYGIQYIVTPNWWLKRWVFTCNHGSIGLVYIIAGTIGGSIGTAFSFFNESRIINPRVCSSSR